MKELDEKIKKEVEVIIEEAMKAFSTDSIDQSVEILIRGWDLLPNEKNQWYEGYLLTKYITTVYFNAGELDKAMNWMPEYFKTDHAQLNFGESEFLAGKLYFELNELAEAKEYFKIANEKSQGRLWEGEGDIKYFKLFKEK